VTRGGYGIKGSGTGEGAETLATYAPNTVFAGNELVGASPTKYVGYTSQNTFPTTVELNQLPTVELNQQPTMFDGLSYIAQYTDLMNAFGANNDAGVAHYINYGIHEGRSTSFDVAGYEQAHPDLQGLYRTNDAFLTAYINTYTTTGHFLT
jgi:hypothetical protein